jgi:hypothetical protein
LKTAGDRARVEVKESKCAPPSLLNGVDIESTAERPLELEPVDQPTRFFNSISDGSAAPVIEKNHSVGAVLSKATSEPSRIELSRARSCTIGRFICSNKNASWEVPGGLTHWKDRKIMQEVTDNGSKKDMNGEKRIHSARTKAPTTAAGGPIYSFRESPRPRPDMVNVPLGAKLLLLPRPRPRNACRLSFISSRATETLGCASRIA